MSALGQKLIPLQGLQLDVANQYMLPTQARFIKNLYYELTDAAEAGTKTGSQKGVLKPVPSTFLYCPFTLPDGENIVIGLYSCRQTTELFAWVWNENDNHTIFRINGATQTVEIVTDPCFNFQLDPRYFIGDTQVWVEVMYLVDPATGNKLRKSDVYWTDGFNYQGYIRFEDVIATSGFNATLFPYFIGNYDKCTLFRMGLPTPSDCIEIKEVPVSQEYFLVHTATVPVTTQSPHLLILDVSFGRQPLFSDRIIIPLGFPFAGTYNVISSVLSGQYYLVTVNETIISGAVLQNTKVTLYTLQDSDNGIDNAILYNTWQFRVLGTDVFGRPSEHGIISDEYIPGINDCIGNNSNIPRCLDLTFNAGNPIINQYQIEFRNCNSTQWYLYDVINLYEGSNIGQWWTRVRNPKLNYDQVNNKITYRFCKNKDCIPIPKEETNRLFNPLAKRSETLGKLNKFIATANNTDGFNPFSQKDILDKIKVNIDPPTAQISTGLGTITVWVATWNPQAGKFTQVTKDGSNGYVFGGYAVDATSGNFSYQDTINNARNYLQNFVNTSQSGHVGYLAGQGNFVVGQQYYVDGSFNLIKDTTFNGIQLSPFGLTLQKFEFTNLSRSKYLFRLCSHRADPSVNPDFSLTSTTVFGTFDFIPSTININTNSRKPIQEVFIDICENDYNTLNGNSILAIYDSTGVTTIVPVIGPSNEPYTAASGYIYETNRSGFNELPMELMSLTPFNDAINSIITDHNGFYYANTLQLNSGVGFEFGFYSSCVYQTFTKNYGAIGMTITNYFIEQISTALANYSLAVCNRVQIKGKALLNGSNIGVSNASVVLTRGMVTQTDNNGNFVIIAHDDVAAELLGQQRVDYLLFTNSGCSYTNPDGTCIGLKTIFFNKCNACVERIFTVTDYVLSFLSFKGLLSGGTYGIGATGFDWLDRATAIQVIKYITIPSEIQTRVVAPSVVSIIIPTGVTFSTEFKYITFWVTQEISNLDYLEWIVDAFKFIDNTGNENTISPTQIKIFYSSIIEYNKQNNFNTTNNWDFISEGTTTPRLGDKVQFIINGDGQFFTKTIVAKVKYEKEGQYILIDYSSDLQNLKARGKIRLIRPNECITENEPFFEICSSRINITPTGDPEKNEIVLNAWDTYYLSRQIPIPVPQSGDPITYINEPYTPGFLFEHHSPSNFWGLHCANLGRVNFANPYEAELIHINEIALSGALSINGQLNYLQYFDDAKKTTFSVTNTGGISGMFPFQGGVLFITQFNNFVVGFDDNLARLIGDNIQVPSGSDLFGKPQLKIGSDYGCLHKDKCTLVSDGGLVYYLDASRSSVVEHNFDSCRPVSHENESNSTIVSWLIKKIRSVNEWNKNNPDNQRYFHIVINPANGEVLVTDFKLHSNEYVNVERDYAYDLSECMAFDPKAKAWKGMYGLTPERYGFIEGEIVGQNQLFAFKNGIAYAQYQTNILNQSYGKIFDISVERIYEWVFCTGNFGVTESAYSKSTAGFDKKKFLNVAVYCPQCVYWSDKIVTETQQSSLLPKSAFKKAERFGFAPLLCALNSFTGNMTPNQKANILTEGEMLLGTWIMVRMIGDKNFDNVYTELYGVTIEYFKSEKSGL